MDSRNVSVTVSSVKPCTISVQQLRLWKTRKINPIDGLVIPNIVVPKHLANKKRLTETNDTIAINIRLLFNSLTEKNINKVSEQLRSTIAEKAKTAEMIEEIAQEIFFNFLISEQNIPNYMHLLNAVSPACVLISQPSKTGTEPGAKVISKTIGNYFLQKCRETIFKYISDDHVKKMAKMDENDLDQLDEYNKEREKINNLIVTLCALYSQRNSENRIKITAQHLYIVIDTIVTSYTGLQKTMAKLGDPCASDGECEDEEAYELCTRMCTLYAEQLYIFMSKKAKDFSGDATLVKGKKMGDLVATFKNQIVPTITESYLQSNCELIEY